MISLKSVASNIIPFTALCFLSTCVAVAPDVPVLAEQTPPTNAESADIANADAKQPDTTPAEAESANSTPPETTQPNTDPSPELLADWLSVVVDNSLSLHNRELPAYRYYVNSVARKNFEDLKSSATVPPNFDYFHRQVAKHRGELVSMKDVTIRRIERVDLPDSASFDTKHLYEMWGHDALSKPWLYVFISPELPAGMKEGRFVEYHADFTGYFLKLQGYHKAGNADTSKITSAPMLIGKFSPATNAPAPPAASKAFTWQMLLLLFLIVIVMSFRFMRFAGVSGALSAIFPKQRVELKEDTVRDQRNLQWIESSLGQSDVDPKKDWP